MEFKRKITAVVLVVIMAIAVLYGSTFDIGEKNENSEIPLFEERQTIYFWYADEALTDYINSAAVSFGEKEGVRVIPVFVSDSEYLEAINRASLKGEQLPDVFILSNDMLEKAYLAGLASNVNDAAGICNSEHFPKAAMDAVTYHDRLIAYPFYYETNALVYNQTYINEWARQQAVAEINGTGDEEYEEPEENSEGAAVQTAEETEIDEKLLQSVTDKYLVNALPDTMDDILGFADTFDAPEGVEGIMEWDVSDIFYNYWFVGNYMIVGGDVGDDTSNININNAEAIQCLEFYKSLNQFFSIESDKVSYESVIQDFIDGKIIFTIGTTDIVERLDAAKADGSLVFDYGIATMPDISDELKSRSMSVTEAVVINGYSENNELANKFAAYLVDTSAPQLYAWSGKVSANAKVEQSDALKVFFAEYSDSVPLPKMMETGDFWMQLEVVFSKAWNSGDAEELLNQLSEGINVNQQ